MNLSGWIVNTFPNPATEIVCTNKKCKTLNDVSKIKGATVKCSNPKCRKVLKMPEFPICNINGCQIRDKIFYSLSNPTLNTTITACEKCFKQLKAENQEETIIGAKVKAQVEEEIKRRGIIPEVDKKQKFYFGVDPATVKVMRGRQYSLAFGICFIIAGYLLATGFMTGIGIIYPVFAKSIDIYIGLETGQVVNTPVPIWLTELEPSTFYPKEMGWWIFKLSFWEWLALWVVIIGPAYKKLVG